MTLAVCRNVGNEIVLYVNLYCLVQLYTGILYVYVYDNILIKIILVVF
jgi:hypothetical protein